MDGDACGEERQEPDEERLHFEKIINAYRNYKRHSCQQLIKKRIYINSMSNKYQARLVTYRTSLNQIEDCIDNNAILMDAIVKDACDMFENLELTELDLKTVRKDVLPTLSDMDKTHSVLKQIARDWSESGLLERLSCYGPILDALGRLYGDKEIVRNEVHVLVPGAGLGRLAHEIACRGYSCQGNEYRYVLDIFTQSHA